MKFEDVYGRWQQRRLDQAEAAEILGHERAHLPALAGRRRRARGPARPTARQGVGPTGADGLGAPGADPYRERYGGFTAKHAVCERLSGFRWSHSCGTSARPRKGTVRLERPAEGVEGRQLGISRRLQQRPFAV